ncbi:MAG: hypothetical protein IPG76_17310 [Acidobacteria bacterium]|nr:hypothetical protein [Acidobacteriota bacterium]
MNGVRGSYAGLMARGGLMVGLTWKDKHVREIRLEAKAPNTFLIQYPDTGPLKMLRRGAWKPVKPENGMIRVKLNKAEKALITTK